MKIGIAYNLKDEFSPAALLDEESIEEFDTVETIDAICGAFEKNGLETVRLGCGVELIDKIRGEKVDFVFNIAEGYSGRNREGYAPSILEILGIPYSGSDPLTLGLTLDKVAAKKISAQAGIPVPRGKAIRNPGDLANIENYLSFPMITKPAWEGSSKGIYNSSKVSDRQELEKNINELLKKYPSQPSLVEDYVEGREITVGVVGNNPPEILGIMEVVNKKYPGEDFFYSIEVKRGWKELVDYVSPPEMGELLEKHIRYYALLAFREFGCRDVARIDFRIGRRDKIFMLEINPLPGLSPEYADLVIMARKGGMDYEGLLLKILDCALARYGLDREKGKNAKRDVSYEAI